MIGNQSFHFYKRRKEDCAMEEMELSKTEGTEKKNKLKKKMFVIAGMTVSAFVVLIGFIILITSWGTLDSSLYGGDYYTEVSKDLRVIESAIRAVTRAIGALISVIGSISLFKFGIEL